MTQHGRNGDASRRDEGGDAFDDFFGHPAGPAEGPDTLEVEPYGNHPETHAESDDPEVTRVIRRGGEGGVAAPAAPVASSDPSEVDSVPTGWWSTDQPAAAAPSAAQGRYEQPYEQRYQQSYAPQGGQGGYGGPPSQPHYAAPPPPRDRGFSPFALLALLVGGLLVGALAMFAIITFMGGDDDGSGQATSTQTTSQQSPSEPSGSGSSPKPSMSSTASPVTRKGELPAGASACSGAKEGTAVARGTEVTSCPFAEAVRDAYLAKDPKGADVSLEVRSPVTGDSYTMRCTGRSVTVCTGGNNAVVYLY